jgi:tRNA A-37 threonylcarbamoyl transferase component Bud32
MSEPSSDELRCPPASSLDSSLPSLHDVLTETGRTLKSATASFSASPSTAQAGAFPGFEILGELGRGGMGVVYKARVCEHGQIVALKTLQVMKSEALFRFKQEFRLRADLSHPNLATLYELVADGEHWFFTMEYVEGVDLLTYVRSASAALSSAEAGGLDDAGHARLRDSLRQLAEGIAALHQTGKLHRDVKPSNVLVTPQGRVVLLDFGLTAELNPEGLLSTDEGHLVGTVLYMSPEQAAGQLLAPASDWYSVGVILYEALTGQRLFPGSPVEVLQAKQDSEAPDPRETAPGAAEDLAALCRELLRRDPAARPAGADILHRLAQPTDFPIAPARETVPLIGRERQLAALADAFASLARGLPIVVRILGSSGVGKTALVQRFLEGIREEDRAVVLTGRCYEQESVPYKALDGVIDSLSRFLRRISPLGAQVLLPRDIVPLLRVFPVLRRVEALAAAPSLRDTPDPQEMRRRAFAALREMLGRLADRRPVIVCVDDLQWGDADSASLLAEVLRPPGAPVVLFLGCYRSDEVATSPFAQALEPLWPQLGTTVERRELPVEALSRAEAQQLAERLLGPVDGTDAIARESGGIPFFVQELVQHMRCGAASAAATSQLALDEVLWARIARLPPGARDLLAIVAISARPVRKAVACRASISGDYLTDLSLLRVHRLMWGTGSREGDLLLPYHDRVRETVQAHLPSEEAGGLHRRLAQALDDVRGEDPEWLAWHWEEAGEGARAAAHYARAAAQAAESLAFDHAAELYRSALRLGQWDAEEGRRLRTWLADALANGGRGKDAAGEYLAAAETASGLDGVELRWRAATQLLISGHIDEGITIFRSVLKSMGLAMPATRRRALLGLLFRQAQLRLRGLRFRQRSKRNSVEDLTRIDICWSAFTGISMIDHVPAAYYQIRGLLLALKSGEPYRVVRALTAAASHIASGGGRTLGKAALLLQYAEETAVQVSNPHIRGLLLLARGIVEYFGGRWRAALLEIDAADQVFRKHCTGVAWELDTAHTFALWSMTYMGWFKELAGRWPALLGEARDRGDRYAITNLSTYIMAVARLSEDSPEVAQLQLRQVMDQWSKQDFHVQHHNAVLAQTLIHLYQGRGAAAFDHITQQWPHYRSSLLLRIQQVRINIVLLRAASAVAAGAKDFLRAAEADIRSLVRERMPWSDALVPLMRAGIACTHGDGRQAVPLLQEALERLNAVDMYIFAQAARRRLGQLVGGDEGRQLIGESEAWMANQGIRNPARMTAVFAPGFPD